jgi:hypothetical protein
MDLPPRNFSLADEMLNSTRGGFRRILTRSRQIHRHGAGAVEKYVVQEKIKVGFQAFVSDGGEEFGAVRQVAPGGRPELVIYVENAGDFTVPISAVEAVHSEKVVLNCAKLDRKLRHAIGHAHDSEKPGA